MGAQCSCSCLSCANCCPCCREDEIENLRKAIAQLQSQIASIDVQIVAESAKLQGLDDRIKNTTNSTEAKSIKESEYKPLQEYIKQLTQQKAELNKTLLGHKANVIRMDTERSKTAASELMSPGGRDRSKSPYKYNT